MGYGSCGEQRTQLLADRGFTAEVGELYVLRSAQGQGAGSRLMRAMSLWVLEQNGAARRFYERVGGMLIAEKRSAEVAYGWTGLRELGSGGAD